MVGENLVCFGFAFFVLVRLGWVVLLLWIGFLFFFLGFSWVPFIGFFCCGLGLYSCWVRRWESCGVLVRVGQVVVVKTLSSGPFFSVVETRDFCSLCKKAKINYKVYFDIV